MLQDFVVLTSAVTGALALMAAARRGVHIVQTRNTRRRVLIQLGRLERLDRRLCALVVELDDILEGGVTWSGVSIWAPELGGHLTYLEGMIDDLARAEAAIRAVDVEGSAERLRADCERMVVVLRLACQSYRDGTLTAYRESNGEPLPMSASGRDQTPALSGVETNHIEGLRSEFTSLMRTCMYRVGNERGAERFMAAWPIRRAERELIRSDSMWGSEPQPIRW